jgi:hypothetical protein
MAQLCNILSTKVVLPWSTCAMIAIFLIFCMKMPPLNFGAKVGLIYGIWKGRGSIDSLVMLD